MNETEHLLTILFQECAEVQQRVSKALRFGLPEVQPGQDKTNAERIIEELNDLYAVVVMLERAGALPPSADPAAIAAKEEKVLRYMAHARECGVLERA